MQRYFLSSCHLLPRKASRWCTSLLALMQSICRASAIVQQPIEKSDCFEALSSICNTVNARVEIRVDESSRFHIRERMLDRQNEHQYRNRNRAKASDAFRSIVKLYTCLFERRVYYNKSTGLPNTSDFSEQTSQGGYGSSEVIMTCSHRCLVDKLRPRAYVALPP